MFAFLAVTGWITVLALWWWGGGRTDREVDSALDSRANRPTVHESAAAAAVDGTWATVEGALREGADPGTGTAAPTPNLQDVLARIAEYRATGKGHPLIALQDLASIDTPAARDALMDLFADADFDFPHRGKLFAMVFNKVEDPRIGPIAADLLQQQLEAGETSAVALNGYLNLVATRHGVAGARMVLDSLHADSPTLRGAAVAELSNIQDPSAVPELLSFVRESPILASGVFDGIAAWGDEASREQLFEFASRSGEDAGARQAAMQAYGRQLRTSELTRVLADYWTAADGSGRTNAIACLHGAAGSARVDQQTLAAHSFDVWSDAVHSGDRALHQDALNLIEYRESFQTDPYVAVIRSLVNDSSVDLSTRRQATRILSLLGG